jgi:hypothetical protein
MNKTPSFVLDLRRNSSEHLAYHFDGRKLFRLARCVPCKEREREKGERKMLWTIFVILLVLWLLGLVTSYTLGGFIHILLILAVVVLVINLVQGRRVI